jgi:hypothetical protein
VKAATGCVAARMILRATEALRVKPIGTGEVNGIKTVSG